MITFDMSKEYGRMTVRQRETEYTVKIVSGNCLAVWIYETEEEYHLYFFLADKKHGERIIKANNTLLGDDVVSIRLNMYYKETNLKLLDLFMKSGYTVECYYEEPKGKESNDVQ